MLCKGLARIEVRIHALPLAHELGFPGGLTNQLHLWVGNHIAHQMLVADTVDNICGVGDDHRLGYPGMGAKHRLDLTEFDAIAANLDLFISASHITQLSVSAPAHQIPGAVHPLPARRFVAYERARHESRAGQPGPAHVAHAHSSACDVQLADHSGRHRTQPRVQHKQCRTRYGETYWHLPRFRDQRRADGGIDGGLGRTVSVDHHPSGCPPVHHLRRTGLGGDHQRRAVQTLRRQHPERRRSLAEHGDFLGDQQRMEVLRGAANLLGHHHQATAVQQRTPHLPDGIVEGIRVGLRPNLVRRRPVADVHGVEQARHIVVGYGHSLGQTGGARGVDDVGNVLRNRPRQRGAGLSGDARIVDIDNEQAAPAQPFGEIGCGDRDDRLGVRHHEFDARLRIGRIDRQIRRPGLEHCQNSHDRLC
nr:hypothetical protein CPGR_04137 [Mycolicibacterium malmesburyense]